VKYLITWVTPALCVIILMTVHGCALRPYPGIPEDVTVQQALDAVEKHSLRVKDFSGSASIMAKMKGKYEFNNSFSIKYIRPDRFRVVVKGFAGIPVALISTQRDSTYIYLPAKNAYIAAGSGDDVLQHIVPGISVSFKQMTSLITGTLPYAEEQGYYRKSLGRYGKRIVLILKRDSIEHRYTLEGPEMLVVCEDILHNGETIWRIKNARFRDADGVMFPRKISMENEYGTVDIQFSRCTINSGLTDNDLLLVIPSSAGRMFIEKTLQQ